MPVHDWTRVDAGVFHDFHQRWIISLTNGLNSGLLPGDYYALAEQVAAGAIPDVVALERIGEPSGQWASTAAAAGEVPSGDKSAGARLSAVDLPPRTRYCHEADIELYAGRASRVVVRHRSGDQPVAFIEIVSPGNKHTAMALRSFMDQLERGLRAGLHWLVIDLHPPTARDPRGIHATFWQQHFGEESAPGVDRNQPLGMASYVASHRPRAYFHPFAVGETLIDMPIFLTPEDYVNVPLERTYQEAWQGVPGRWKSVVESGAG